MFKRTDRILVAVHDLDQAAGNFHSILGAVAVDERDSPLLGARVRILQLGDSQVELCRPLGEGPVLKHLDKFGEGLYCGGVSVTDMDECRRTLAKNGIRYAQEANRLYPEASDMHGLALAISEECAQPVQAYSGPVDYLYEITQVLETRWQTVAAHYSGKLGLDEKNFVGITFPRFGYEGVLMKFSDERLDRIELSEAHDPAFPMGRFTNKRGDALYMCYVETNDLAEIIARLETHGQQWTRRTNTPIEQDGLWIHPKALNGVLMGVSRRTLAWGWSGKPEQVQALQGSETA
ncbi:MAG: VOC family protein [Burkholderiaceae bacterium]